MIRISGLELEMVDRNQVCAGSEDEQPVMGEEMYKQTDT